MFINKIGENKVIGQFISMSPNQIDPDIRWILINKSTNRQIEAVFTYERHCYYEEYTITGVEESPDYLNGLIDFDGVEWQYTVIDTTASNKILGQGTINLINNLDVSRDYNNSLDNEIIKEY